MEALEQIFRQILTASLHGSVLVAVIFTIQTLAGNRLGPRWKHGLWMLLLVRLALPELPDSSLSPLNLAPTSRLLSKHSLQATPIHTEFSRLGTTLSNDQPTVSSVNPDDPTPTVVEIPVTAALAPSPTSVRTPLNLFQWLSLVWVAGSIVLIIRLAVQSVRFSRQVKQRTYPIPPQVRRALLQAGQQFGLNDKKLQVIATDQIRTPCLVGLFSTKLLLPKELPNVLSERELEWVCLHELAHLKRRDILFTWLESFLQCVHWFNPIIWWSFARLRADRELATDDLVLRRCRSIQPSEYGETIVKVLQHLSRSRLPLAGVLGIAEWKTRIKERIQAIARFSPTVRTSPWIILGSLCLVLFCMLEAQSTTNVTAEGGRVQMQVHLRDYETHSPIAMGDLSVRLLTRSDSVSQWAVDPRSAITAQTDDAGNATLFDLPSDIESITISLSHPDYLSVNRSFGEINHTPIPDKITLQLLKPIEVSGTVKTDLGLPLDNAKVYLSFTQPNTRYAQEYWIAPPKEPVITDRQGRWSVSSIPADLQHPNVRITHPNYAQQPRKQVYSFNNSANYTRWIPADRDSLINGTHVSILEPGGLLRGTISRHIGQPIPNARVALPGIQRKALTTDEQGKFELPFALTGPVNLILSAPGYSPKSVTTTITTEGLPQSFHLDTGHHLAFKVVDLDGNPIENVLVSPGPWTGEPMAPRYSDHNGDYLWTNPPTGEIEFRFRKTGYRDTPKRVYSAQQEPYVIEMEPALNVSFEVTDKKGRPLSDVKLYRGTLSHPGPVASNHNYIPLTHWYDADGHFHWVDGTGSFSITESSAEDPKAQHERLYIYRVEVPGFRTETSRLVSAREYDATLRFELHKITNAPKRLQLANGEPLPGARLWILQKNQVYSVNLHTLTAASRRAESVHTKTDGSFLLPDRNQVEYVLGLLPEGFVFAPNTQESPYIVRPWASIRGRCTDQGAPVAGHRMGIRLGQEYDSPYPHLNFESKVDTDEDGQFAFQRVPPTSIKLLEHVRIGETIRMSRLVQKLVATSGREHETNFERPTGTVVSGQVQLSENLKGRFNLRSSLCSIQSDLPEPPYPENIKNDPNAKGAWFRIWSQTYDGQQHEAYKYRRSCTLILSKDGRFQTPRLLPGVYQMAFNLKVRPADGGIARLSNRLTEDVAHRFTIDSSSPASMDLGMIEIKEASTRAEL